MIVRGSELSRFRLRVLLRRRRLRLGDGVLGG